MAFAGFIHPICEFYFQSVKRIKIGIVNAISSHAPRDIFCVNSRLFVEKFRNISNTFFTAFGAAIIFILGKGIELGPAKPVDEAVERNWNGGNDNQNDQAKYPNFLMHDGTLRLTCSFVDDVFTLSA